MTSVELHREAHAIVPPLGATKAIATHDGAGYRAAFLIDNRLHSKPVGPSFTKPRALCAFVDILNGDAPTSRPGSDDFAGAGAPSSEDARVQPETLATHPAPPGSGPVSVLDPDVAVPASAAGVRTCEVCGKPLPPGSRSHRRTDTDACRRALGRAEADGGRVDDTGVGVLVPLSRASDEGSPAEILAAHKADVIRACTPKVPTSPAARDARALPRAAEDAGPALDPGQRPVRRLDALNPGLT